MTEIILGAENGVKENILYEYSVTAVNNIGNRSSITKYLSKCTRIHSFCVLEEIPIPSKLQIIIISVDSQQQVAFKMLLPGE